MELLKELQGTADVVEQLHTLSEEALERLCRRYPWFRPLRIEQQRRGGVPSAVVSVVAPWRVESSLVQGAVDAEQLLHLSTEDLIDRFLSEENLRIVAEEGEVENEVQTEAQLSDDEELVSEDLAEIYLAQGLRDEAKAIYRKLSLLNPEKSVYFAELIDRIENK